MEGDPGSRSFSLWSILERWGGPMCAIVGVNPEAHTIENKTAEIEHRDAEACQKLAERAAKMAMRQADKADLRLLRSDNEGDDRLIWFKITGYIE